MAKDHYNPLIRPFYPSPLIYGGSNHINHHPSSWHWLAQKGHIIKMSRSWEPLSNILAALFKRKQTELYQLKPPGERRLYSWRKKKDHENPKKEERESEPTPRKTDLKTLEEVEEECGAAAGVQRKVVRYSLKLCLGLRIQSSAIIITLLHYAIVKTDYMVLFLMWRRM